VPHFAYKGRDAGGKLVHGELEGADQNAVADRLMQTGITPLDISPSGAARASIPGFLARLQDRKPARDDVLMFSRQMHTLLKAGVPIMGALKGLQDSTTSPAFAAVIQDLRESLDAGRELSVSLARHPKVFSPFYVSMVRVGEFTGQIEEIFLRLFEHMEFEKFMRDQVKAAIRYPVFVLATMALAIVIINLFVIPAFAKVFAGFKAELPYMTRLMIGVSNFSVAYWPVMAVGLGAAYYGFRGYVNTGKGRLVWDRLKLGIPVAGKIVHKATMARFARSLSLALRSGVPVVQALTTVSHTVDNEYIAARINAMREGVERGESVLRCAAVAGVFTPVVLQMVAVGEESGALDELLGEVADMYQRDVEYELKTLASQIEPILIVALGVLVLILALGVFLPLWDLGNVALGRR
jgi:MSHA biogenesis protein MshG